MHGASREVPGEDVAKDTYDKQTPGAVLGQPTESDSKRDLHDISYIYNIINVVDIIFYILIDMT